MPANSVESAETISPNTPSPLEIPLNFTDLRGVPMKNRSPWQLNRFWRLCNLHLANQTLLLLGLTTISLCSFVGCKPEEVARKEEEAAIAAKEAQANAAQQNLQAQKAGVGVGEKGRSLEGGSENNPATLISGPAAALFRTKEKIAFEIQIPKAMSLYMAEKGRNPRNHDEFMRDIIEFNRIQLPKLPNGMLYRYLPDKGDQGELWVIPEKELQPQN